MPSPHPHKDGNAPVVDPASDEVASADPSFCDRLNARDPAAWNELAALAVPGAAGVCRRMWGKGNGPDAACGEDDIIQNALLKVWMLSSDGKLHLTGSEEGYLRSAMRHLAIFTMRRRGSNAVDFQAMTTRVGDGDNFQTDPVAYRVVAGLEDRATPEAMALHTELRAELERAIDFHLDPRSARLVRYRFEGMKVAEITEAENLPRSERGRISRAIFDAMRTLAQSRRLQMLLECEPD